jgi:lysophospholipase L1-like esterase
VELRCQRGIVPVFVLIPNLTDVGAMGRIDHRQLAKENGFPIVDLSDLYDNKDRASFRMSESDEHPNAAGHKLIADRL